MKRQLLLFISSVLVCLSVQSQAVQQLPPPVPQYVVFAGETIRFDRADLRERIRKQRRQQIRKDVGQKDPESAFPGEHGGGDIGLLLE